jgi:hypothetical protein
LFNPPVRRLITTMDEPDSETGKSSDVHVREQAGAELSVEAATRKRAVLAYAKPADVCRSPPIAACGQKGSSKESAQRF